jgi:hypothetical protein
MEIDKSAKIKDKKDHHKKNKNIMEIESHDLGNISKIKENIKEGKYNFHLII